MFERALSEGKEVVVMGDMNCNLLVSTSLVDQLLLITEEMATNFRTNPHYPKFTNSH